MVLSRGMPLALIQNILNQTGQQRCELQAAALHKHSTHKPIYVFNLQQFNKMAQATKSTN